MTSISFDTSAVVGLVERRSSTIISIVNDVDHAPGDVWSTLAELQHSVAIATDRRAARRRMLDVAIAFRSVRCFSPEVRRSYASISVHAARRLSQFDRWIIATGVASGSHLVTQDSAMFEVATVSVIDTTYVPVESLNRSDR